MSDDDLLAQLPGEARAAFLLARAAKQRFDSGGDRSGFAEAATQAGLGLAAAGIPRATGVFPLASAYDEVQRAALTWCTLQDLGTARYACPSATRTRRRWLGLDRPGLLEAKTVVVEHDGVTTTEPLWRALQIAHDAEPQAAILDALPCDVALTVLGELHTVGIGYAVDFNALFTKVRLLRDLREEGREWAVAQADVYPTDAYWKGSYLKAYIFLALVRAGVRIEPRWEHLYPNVMGASRDLLFECAHALPEDRRAAALAPHLPSMSLATEIVAEFPTSDMVRALLDGTEANSVRWTWLVEKMRELGKTQPVVAAAVEAIVAATPKPLDLYVTSMRKPTSAAELSDLEREQLRISGKGYDQQDLDAEARLADDGSETTFRGSFEVRSIADANGSPVYDALLYLDEGSIFRAGTTEEIGGMSQGGVVLKDRNDALRLALQVAVGKKPLRRKAKTAPAAKAASTTPKRLAKKTAPKKPKK
jgi:hypothetical protein